MCTQLSSILSVVVTNLLGGCLPFLSMLAMTDRRLFLSWLLAPHFKKTHLTMTPSIKQMIPAKFYHLFCMWAVGDLCLLMALQRRLHSKPLLFYLLLHLMVVFLAVSVNVSCFFVKNISVFLGVSSTHQNMLLPHTVCNLWCVQCIHVTSTCNCKWEREFQKPWHSWRASEVI